MQILKNIFTFYAAQSTYPNINSRDFRNIANRCGLVDRKNIHTYTLDMMFAAVNYDQTGNIEDNPTTELVRYEFIELIVRIAKKLYPNESSSDAIEMVIFDHLEPLYEKDLSIWANFREQKLH